MSDALASNDFQPSDVEHEAIVGKPELFQHDSFRRDDVQRGVVAVVGTLADGSGEAAYSYLFDSQRFSEGDAQFWVAKRRLPMLRFSPAKRSQFPTSLTSSAERFAIPCGPAIVKAQGDKPARISIAAYDGRQVMSIGGVPTVIALDGLDVSGDIKLLAEHDDTLDSLLGNGRATIRGNKLLVDGTLTRATDRARQIIAMSKDGVNFDASVGVEVLESERLAAGESEIVNGTNFTAGREGLRIVKRGILRETSLVAVGACPKTLVSIAASSKGKRMENDVETIRAAAVAERQRIAAITETSERLCASWGLDDEQHRTMRAKISRIEREAIEGGHDANEAELAMLRGSRPLLGSMVTGRPSASNEATLQAAFALHLGQEQMAEKEYGAAACDCAKRLHARHVLDLVRCGLQMHNVEVPSDTREMLRAGFSTLQLPALLSNIATKAAQQIYQTLPSVARRVCKPVSVPDFKVGAGIRLGAGAMLERIGSQGEIPHGILDEGVFSFQAQTYGKMFQVSRQDLYNDDLGSLADIPVLLARGSALKLESEWAKLFMDNAAVFTGARNNYISGASTPLALTGLAAGYAALEKMTDENGQPIMAIPRFLVVPPELGVTARNLVGSPQIVGGTTGGPLPVLNSLAGLVEVLDSPYLSNTSYTGYSTTAWYLLCDPSTLPVMVIAYLDGAQNPTIQSEQADFDTLGMSFRGFFDFGAGWADWRGGLMSKGSA